METKINTSKIFSIILGFGLSYFFNFAKGPLLTSILVFVLFWFKSISCTCKNGLVKFLGIMELSIKKAPYKIKMIQLEHESFLKTLRDKLLWGKDKRN